MPPTKAKKMKGISESLPSKRSKTSSSDAASLDNTLTVIVKNGIGEEKFRVKKTTKMLKVFENYAIGMGVGYTELRFLLNGEQIEDGATPEILGLKDSDQIECILETGSLLSWETLPVRESSSSSSSWSSSEVKEKIKPKTATDKPLKTFE